MEDSFANLILVPYLWRGLHILLYFLQQFYQKLYATNMNRWKGISKQLAISGNLQMLLRKQQSVYDKTEGEYQ